MDDATKCCCVIAVCFVIAGVVRSNVDLYSLQKHCLRSLPYSSFYSYEV